MYFKAHEERSKTRSVVNVNLSICFHHNRHDRNHGNRVMQTAATADEDEDEEFYRTLS